MAPMLAAPGALVLLQQLSRHGARSPKSKYPSECPNDPFTNQWDSWNAGLSGPGHLEAAAVGSVTRQMYGAWLGPYNGSQMLVRSGDSDRVLQSAQVAMSTLLPPGTGPEGGLDGRPTIVPIHTVPEEEDSLLAIDKGGCHARSKADCQRWWKATGAGIWEAGHAAVAPVTAFCGVEATKAKVFKDQVDGIGFDIAAGFALNGFGADQLLAAQNLTMVLQRGCFTHDEARTYMAGDFPATLVANMEKAIEAEGSDQKYIAYFSHRQALYSLAEFFGWDWTQYGIPEGMVQTGTTVWLELRHGEEAGQYDVALLQWSPHCGLSSLEACPVDPITLPGCARGTTCSFDEFRAIVSQRVARTGSWEKLCGAELMV